MKSGQSRSAVYVVLYNPALQDSSIFTSNVTYSREDVSERLGCPQACTAKRSNLAPS